MAQRTIAPGGGNINVAATFVEVAVPGTADFIVGNASSGQLTVNVNTTVQFVDFTGYTNVLTINPTFALTLGQASVVSTFSSAATYAGTGLITPGANARLSGSADISPIGLNIPNTPVFLNSNMTVGNLQSLKSGFQRISYGAGGPFTIGVKGNLTTNSNSLGFNMQGGTIEFLGTGTQSIGLFGNPTTQATLTGVNIIFNHTGTVVINILNLVVSEFADAGRTNINNSITYIQGSITGTKKIKYSSINRGAASFAFAPLTLNLEPTTGWDLDLNYTGAVPYALNLVLLSNFNFTSLTTGIRSTPMATFGGNLGGNYPLLLRLSGTGRLNGGKLVIPQSKLYNTTGAVTVENDTNIRLQIGNTASHIVSEFITAGNLFPTVISSQTASTTAFFGISGTSSVMLAQFTDIDASSAPFKVFQSTLTRTSGITNFDTLGGGGGGGGGSFVYLT